MAGQLTITGLNKIPDIFIEAWYKHYHGVPAMMTSKNPNKKESKKQVPKEKTKNPGKVPGPGPGEKGKVPKFA
jgi:hypothetical protein